MKVQHQQIVKNHEKDFDNWKLYSQMSFDQQAKYLSSQKGKPAFLKEKSTDDL